MKLLCIPGDAGACSHYRIFNPYWKLGPDYLVSFTYDPADPNFHDADVLVIPRVHTPLSLKVMKDFLATGRPVILDFDDNFHSIPWYNPAGQIFAPGSESIAIFEEALEIATVVTVSTQPLADAYKHRRDDIAVCPNFISQEHFDTMAPKEITGEPKMKDQIRIGYVGSHTHFGDVALLAEPLTKIMEQYQMPEIRYVFLGYPPVVPLHVRMRCEYSSGIVRAADENVADFMLRYYQEIQKAQLDIALAPLEDNAFNRCKSNIKLLEYGIAGVPIISNLEGPYATYSDDVIFGCGETETWNEITFMIENPGLRKELAEANLAFIKQNHTTKASIGAWQQMLKRVEKASV